MQTIYIERESIACKIVHSNMCPNTNWMHLVGRTPSCRRSKFISQQTTLQGNGTYCTSQETNHSKQPIISLVPKVNQYPNLFLKVPPGLPNPPNREPHEIMGESRLPNTTTRIKPLRSFSNGHQLNTPNIPRMSPNS